MKEDETEMRMLVRLLRAALDCTQEELAQKAGLDLSTIHRYETGNLPVTNEVAERLVRAAGISPSFLHHSLLPFVSALRAELTGKGSKTNAGIEELAEGVGRKVGAKAREEALAFLSGLKPLP